MKKFWRNFLFAWRCARRGRLLYYTHADARCLVHLPSIVGTVEMQNGDVLAVHIIPWVAR